MRTKSIQNHIKAKGAGWIFSAMDFNRIANRNSVDQTLSRLSRKGSIRKLATGLYDTPVINKRFGALPPDPDKAAHALAQKLDYHLQVNPVQAAHSLGLTQQVPTQAVYLTDGLSKTIKVGNQTLKFVHASPKKMVGAGTKAGLIIQALYYFGKDNLVESFLVPEVRALLNDKDKHILMDLTPKTPLWMQPLLKRILQNA
jgi:hypothetical protein